MADGIILFIKKLRKMFSLAESYIKLRLVVVINLLKHILYNLILLDRAFIIHDQYYCYRQMSLSLMSTVNLFLD